MRDNRKDRRKPLQCLRNCTQGSDHSGSIRPQLGQWKSNKGSDLYRSRNKDLHLYPLQENTNRNNRSHRSQGSERCSSSSHLRDNRKDRRKSLQRLQYGNKGSGHSGSIRPQLGRRKDNKGSNLHRSRNKDLHLYPLQKDTNRDNRSHRPQGSKRRSSSSHLRDNRKDGRKPLQRLRNCTQGSDHNSSVRPQLGQWKGNKGSHLYRNRNKDLHLYPLQENTNRNNRSHRPQGSKRRSGSSHL